MIKITKGLDLPITGMPEQKIYEATSITRVALLGDDYVGMKPTMMVNVGDQVKKGQKLFEDKKIPGVFFTSPACGKVIEINRGERRVFQSLVIEKSADEQISFQGYREQEEWGAESVESLLIESGLWTSLRTRPFSKTPAPGSKPSSLFVNCMDTNPGAANPEVVINERLDDFKKGLSVLTQLAPQTFVSVKEKSTLDLSDIDKVKVKAFAGPHPAGNVGTHIHYLDPVSLTKSVWHINYQDVLAIGVLFATGKLDTRRVVSISGPLARNPRLVRTEQGACLSELTAEEVYEKCPLRVISGSVFSGRTAQAPFNFLGKFHLQVTMLEEGVEREFLGWHSPGINKFSVMNIYLSKLFPKKRFNFNTNTNGSVRSIVPIGAYEAVMPGDFLPTQLLRFLMSKNTEQAQLLGALELDEEDLSLCTFVDPCKNEYGPVLRENLTLIEKEG